jgi:hypothetical protein
MRTREAYVYAGGAQGIDTGKATAWGIGRLWWEHDDPTANAGALAACRKRGVGVGLKYNGTGAAVATAASLDLTAHGFGTSTGPMSCGVMFDDEGHDGTGTLDLLERWRTLRPTRYTFWTLEPFQGGALTPDLVAFVNADVNLLVLVQCYGTIAGDELYPAMQTAAVDDLVLHGLRRERVRCFLGVKAPVQSTVPYGWEGVLYGFQALPATPPAPL